MPFKKLLNWFKPNVKVLYAGGKIVIGGILVKTAEFIKPLEVGSDSNALSTIDSSINAVAESGQLGPYYSQPYTVSGMLESVGTGFVMSGTWDMVKMGAAAAHNVVCGSKKDTEEAAESEEAQTKTETENHAKPINKKKKRKLKKQAERDQINDVRNEQIDQELSLQRRAKLLFATKTLMELWMFGYFIVSLIEPIKKWFNIQAEQNNLDIAENAIRSFMDESLHFFKEPDSIIKKLLEPGSAVLIASALSLYNIIEGLRITKSGQVNLNERPLAGIIKSIAFSTLAESALIKHSKIFAVSQLHDYLSKDMALEMGTEIAKIYLMGFLAQGMDLNTAKQKTTILASMAYGFSRDQAKKMISQKAGWLLQAKLIKYYGQFKLAESLFDALCTYIQKRREDPLQTRMESVRRAFLQRPDRTQFFDTERDFLYADLPKAKSSAVSQFPEEKIDEEARERKLLERRAREARALQRSLEENELKSMFEAQTQTAREALTKKQRLTEMLTDIRNLNSDAKETLKSILEKGSHQNLDDASMKSLFGEPGTTPNIRGLHLKNSSGGILVQSDDTTLTSYHRQHGKAIHERVFNKIRDKLEYYGITSENIDELLEPDSGTGLGLG